MGLASRAGRGAAVEPDRADGLPEPAAVVDRAAPRSCVLRRPIRRRPSPSRRSSRHRRRGEQGPRLPAVRGADGARPAAATAVASPACASHGRGRAASDLHADLVVGGDGRASAVRRRAASRRGEQGAPPMDIVWCKMPALPGLRGARGYVGGGHLLIAYRPSATSSRWRWAIVRRRLRRAAPPRHREWVEEMAGHVSAGSRRPPARARGRADAPVPARRGLGPRDAPGARPACC